MIPIQLDKPRHLHFDLTTIQDLETQMQLPLGTIIKQLGQAGVRAIVTTLYFGLKHEDPGLNPSLVTKILTTYLSAGQSVLPIASGLNAALLETGIFQGVPVKGNGTRRPRRRPRI